MAQPALTRGDILRIVYGTGDTAYVDISKPIFPYETTINLPWDISQQDDNTYDIFDHAVDGSLDTRQCVCVFMLTATEHANLISALTTTAKGRAKQVTLQTIADSGFFPFGPDKGDTGDTGAWPVTCEILDTGAIGPAPWKHFRPKLRFTFQGAAYPAWTMPADETVYPGPITIGAGANRVQYVRFPELWFQPKAQYGINTTVMNGFNGTAQYWNGSASGDGWTTGFELKMRIAKACRVIDYLVNIGRSESKAGLSLAVPVDCYPFGVERGSGGTYTVKMIQDNIVIKHNAFNNFTAQFNFAWMAGP